MKRLILFLAATLFFTACANKSMTRYEALAPVFEHNGYDATISEIKKQQDDLYGEKTEFLYYFDLGVLYHYNGNYAESAKNFDKADKIYDDLYTRSITNEAAAIVTNDNIRPYRARPFEILVLHEMQIMNYLAQKNVDGALVEVNRALKAMTELYQKDNDKTNDNGFLRYLTAIVYEMAGEPDEAAIAYYKTVKAYDENILNLPKEAREFVIENLKRSDREDDLKALKLDNSIETPKAKAAYDLGQEIIVVGYAGHGPILTELKMSGTYVSGGLLNLTYKDSKTGQITSTNLGAPPVAGASNGETFHISFALPEAHSFRSQVQRFNVTVDNQSGIRPEKVMALDNVNMEIRRGEFVAVTGGDMERFEKPRDIGPWLGVTPRQDQSGDVDRQCHITKAGSKMLRWKLTECAQRVLQKNSADMDLKVKGLRIRARGGKIARGKSVTAVARGLAVLMVAMLKKPDEPYVPLSEDKAKELAQIRAAMTAA